MAICNDSKIDQKDGQWIVVGEPTEGALCSLAQKVGFDLDSYQRIAAEPSLTI